jgi:hypothetical protein
MAMRYYAPFPGGGGDPARPRGPHGLRIGDAERDAAAADLGEHYAAGRLTLDELHQRLDAVFAARTVGQLTRIMADLPGSALLALRWHGSYPPGCGLPGAPRPPWTTGGGPQAYTGAHPGPVPYGGWGAAAFRCDGQLRTASESWRVPDSPEGFQTRQVRESLTPADRAGRVAALSLLLLAMLIWLFTALLFARHGIYHPPTTPVGPPGYPPGYPPGG